MIEKKSYLLVLAALIFSLLMGAAILFAGGLETSSEQLRETILWDIRFPRVLVALVAGGSLALSGLLLQSLFQNPLAGPYVLGLSSGASLMVALWTIGIGTLSLPTWLESGGVVLAASLGSGLMLVFVLFCSMFVRGTSILLIIGLLLGHVVGGLVQILLSWSELEELRSYILWTFGSFQKVFGNDLIILVSISIVGWMSSLFLVRKLNALQLGEKYAKGLGVSLKSMKLQIIGLSSLLSGAVTAYCGPVVFVGLLGPALARLLLMRGNHLELIPASIALGSSLALAAEFLSGLSSTMALPVNSVLGIVGTPLFAFIIFRNRRTLA